MSSPLPDCDNGDFGGESACRVPLTFLTGGEVDTLVRDVAVVRELEVTLELRVDALFVDDIVRARIGRGDTTAGALGDAGNLDDTVEDIVFERTGETGGGLLCFPLASEEDDAVLLIIGEDAEGTTNRRVDSFLSASSRVPLSSAAVADGLAGASADLTFL